MTQHEYIFIAVSIILGLAITRLLRTAAALIRAKERVVFHWSSGLWAFSVMLYISNHQTVPYHPLIKIIRVSTITP